LDQARRFYDRLGAGQDTQAFYEDAAVGGLLAHARLHAARSIFEFGCGTGRVAERILEECAPATCRYRGIDVSETMVRLASRRLARWNERVEVLRVDGSAGLPAQDGEADRFVSTFVFDLLGDDALRATLAEAHRVLAPGGLLCLAGATSGRDALGRLVSSAAACLNRIAPAVLGGCRPIELTPFLRSDTWRILHHAVVRSWGVSSEILVAERRG
jgi:ubiquinone/menaquinone biosynthesis C-methylase UbiE